MPEDVRALSTKVAAALIEAMRATAPVTQNVMDVVTFSPPKVLADKSFTDRAGDYSRALKEIDTQADEDKEPLNRRMVRHIATSAGIGAGAGLLKATLIERGFGKSTLPIVGGFAALGGISAGLFHGLRHARRKQLRQHADDIVAATPEEIKTVAAKPELRKDLDEFGRSGWYPFYGMETGALAGSLGTLGARWAAGADRANDLSAATIAAVPGAIAGGALGYWLRENRRKKLLRNIQTEFAPMNKAAADNTPYVYSNGYRQAPKNTGGNPSTPSNQMLMRGTNTDERFSAGRQVHGNGPQPVVDQVVARFAAGAPNRRGVTKLASDAEAKVLCDYFEKVAALARGPKLRPRAEIIIVGPHGIVGIDKGDYLLFPGGGINDGESPRDAVLRELWEEAGINVINIVPHGVVDTVWPETGPMRDEDFDGERTYFFVGKHAGKVDGDHADREDFKELVPDEVEVKLSHLYQKGDWAMHNNAARAHAVEHVHCLTSGTHKQAAAADDALAFSLNGPYMPEPVITENTDPDAPLPPVAPAPAMQPAPAPAQPAVPAPIPAPQQVPPTATAPAKSITATPQIGEVTKTAAVIPQIPGIPQDPTQAYVNGLVQKQVQPTEAPTPAEQANTTNEINTESETVAAPMAPVAPAPMNPTAAPPQAPTAAAPPSLGSVPDLPLSKVADAVVLQPRKQFVMFTPDGKLVIRRGQKRRFDLPEEGVGKPAPYEPAIDVVPDTGVPEPGYHGYRYGLQLGDTPTVPQGYEAIDPNDALSELYASMGHKENRPYQGLDRARSRVILRALRKRMNAANAAPVVPPPQV